MPAISIQGKDTDDLFHTLLVDSSGSPIITTGSDGVKVRPRFAGYWKAPSGRFVETSQNLSLPVGYSTLNCTAVPAGYFYRCTRVAISYVGVVAGVVLAINAILNSITCRLLRQDGIGSGSWYPALVDILMAEGDYIQAVVSGATLNDDLYINYSGEIIPIE
jgi:hypothetical protein